MRLLAAATPFLLASCNGGADRSHDETIEQIEKQVRLPDDAGPLASYARYYTRDADLVVGIYITFVDPRYRKYDLARGLSRWVDDPRDLPSLPDSGCSAVNVIYDPVARKIEHVACEGFG